MANKNTKSLSDFVAKQVIQEIGKRMHEKGFVNQDTLSWEKDLFEAYHRLETMEHNATVLMNTERVKKKEINHTNYKQVQKASIANQGKSYRNAIPTNISIEEIQQVKLEIMAEIVRRVTEN